MKKKRLTTGVLCLGLSGLLLAGGCGREESTTYSTPEGEVTVTTGKEAGQEVMTVETEQGALTVYSGPQAIDEARLGVPLYPGAHLVSSAQVAQQGSEAASYLLASNDDFEEVAAFYRANLKDVRQSMSQSMGGQKMAMFLVGDEKNMKSVQVTDGAVEGKTAIQVTWLPAE